MRNHQFETPFIAFYRKEYVEPELNIHDLFKIYHWDEKVGYVSGVGRWVTDHRRQEATFS